MKTKIDVEVDNHGTVVLLWPNSSLGQDWFDEHLQVEPWQMMGRAIACEPRMVQDIIDDMEADGLVVSIL